MVLKSGSPTNFRVKSRVEKRHERVRQGVGETYKERQSYEMKRAEVEASRPGPSFISKVKDFFSFKGNSVSHASDAAYHPESVKTISQYHKDIENGVQHRERTTDNDLFAILNNVNKSYETKS